MKSFLLIALMLAVFGGNVDCSPNLTRQQSKGKQIMSNGENSKKDPLEKGSEVEKKPVPKLEVAPTFPAKSSFKIRDQKKELRKTVSFNDYPDFRDYPATTSDGIFWINEMKFQQNIQQKSNTLSKTSKKKKLLDVLTNVLVKNFRMIAQIYIFVVKFDGYDIILSQTKMPSSDKMFPTTEMIAKLDKTKEDFKDKLIRLFNLIEPASEFNEDLSNMIDMIDDKTKVTQKQLDELYVESQKVNAIFQRFEYAIKEFKIGTYKKHLSNIRVTTNQLEDKVISQFDASFSSQTEIIELNKLCPKMDKALDAAMEINFTELEEKMKKCHSLAKTVLNIKEASCWSGGAKKGKKIKWTFGIPIFTK